MSYLVFWQRVSVSLCLSFSLSDPAGVCNLLYRALVLQRKASIMSASCVTRCLTLRPSSCVTWSSTASRAWEAPSSVPSALQVRGPARGVGGVEVVGSGAVKEWGEVGGIHTATDGRGNCTQCVWSHGHSCGQLHLNKHHLAHSFM